MKANKLSIALTSILLFCFNGCIRHDTPELQLQPAGQGWGALYQQHAAEYKALCFQAYYLARIRLDERIRESSGKPTAIITDIDETVLDNSPYFARLAKDGKVYSDSSWVEWTAEMRCDTVPGAVHFLSYAAGKGVTIFYVSNRFQQELVPTVRNLEKWKLPDADEEHVLLLNTGNSSKESRRLSIEKDYEVVLYLGDNLGDFSYCFDHLKDKERSERTQEQSCLFGRKFIVLPNYMYGEWEDVLYRDKSASSIDTRNKILDDYLN